MRRVGTGWFWLLAAAAAAAILGADWIAPHPPNWQFRDAVLVPPAWVDSGDRRFLLGTDDVGRDLLSRLIHGARLSLAASAGVALGALLVGGGLGALAVAIGGRGDALIMRSMDALLAVPSLLLAMAVAAILGGGLVAVVLAVTLAAIPHFARVSRAAALTEAAKDYVLAARALGAGPSRIAFRVVAPNCAAPLQAQAALTFAAAASEVAALGFLGLGPAPPAAEWGGMLASSISYFYAAPWTVAAPGAAIMLVSVAFIMAADGLAQKKWSGLAPVQRPP